MSTRCPKLYFKTPLKLDFNSTFELQSPTGWNLGEKTCNWNSTFWIPVFTTHISPKYHPNIIQISSKYHPDINLVKTWVLTQIWHDYFQWKLHFDFNSSWVVQHLLKTTSNTLNFCSNVVFLFHSFMDLIAHILKFSRIQCYPQRMRLQRRLYWIYSVCFPHSWFPVTTNYIYRLQFAITLEFKVVLKILFFSGNPEY